MKVLSLIQALSLLVVWISNSNSLCGTAFPQEVKNAPIQKKAADSKVELLQDQIRQTERRLSILGPKHPNWESTNKKIKELQAKLDQILSPQSNPSGEKPGSDALENNRNANNPTESALNDPLRNTKRVPEKENLREAPKNDGNQTKANSARSIEGITSFPAFSPETGWIYQTYAQSEASQYVGYRKTPKIVEELGRLSVGWDRRFSQDLTRGINRVGFVSATNYVYGIEYDPVVGISSLWGWFNSTESRKSLVLRTEGELLDFVFAPQTGGLACFYILRRQKDAPNSIELLAVDIDDTVVLEKSLPVEILMATLTPDFPSRGRFGPDLYFSEGPEDTLLVLSDTGFTSTISQDTMGCAQLDPLSMIFWDSDQSPNIQKLRSFWMSISGSSNKNERVLLISDEQIVLHRPQGIKSCFVIKGRDGKVRSEVLVPELQLESLSVRGVSRIFIDQNKKNARGYQDLVFLADNQISICRTQDLGMDTSVNKTIASYQGRILQLTKDPEGRLLILTEDGLFTPTSLEHPLSDNPTASTLSIADTGLFTDVSKLQPREFFWEYYPSVSSGCHGDKSKYFVAFPEGASVKDLGRQGWLFPEGTIFLQMPSMERSRLLNPRVKSEPMRILIKSQGQWQHCVYPLDSGSFGEVDSAVGQRSDDAILSSDRSQLSVNQNCWDCHSRSFNDGIQSFHDSALDLVSPTGVLQSEYLRQVRVLGRDHYGAGSMLPNRPKEDSTQLLSEILRIVRRIQTLAPNWYGKEFRQHDSTVPLDTGLNDVRGLLWIDAFLVTGDERFHNLLIDGGWWEFAQDRISEWLISVTAAESDKSLDEDLYLDFMASLISTHPEIERANVHRLFAKAALVVMNVRETSSTYPPPLSRPSIPRYTASRSFDIAWTDTLLEYYSSVGAPWALQDAKEIMGGFTIPKEVSVVVQSDRVEILRYCLLSLRAFELTGDSHFLEKSREVWEFFESLAPKVDASIEELVLKAHCALRFLFLDVDVVASPEYLRALASFESLLIGSGLSDSQKEFSIELRNDKLAISKALIESKRIIPDLLMFRRTRIDR